MRTIAIGTLALAAVATVACDADGAGVPLSAAQQEEHERPSSDASDLDGPDDGEDQHGDRSATDRDDQGGGHGVDAPLKVAEHTLGADRGFTVTASLEDGQVCLTATPMDDGDRGTVQAVDTDCAAADTPLDLRVLVVGDLAVLAGVVTDLRVADVTLVDLAGDPVPDEVDAAPLVELPGTDHRVFVAATPPGALHLVEVADADGTVVGERKVSAAARVGHAGD
jgi:hypothetical protein